MPRLYVPIGIPGSGKSTWTRLLRAAVISTDDIRAEAPGGYVHSHEANLAVFNTFHERIGHYLSREVDVVADATNLQAKHRRSLLDIAVEQDADMHYIVFTNVAQAVLRNARRGGVARVPDEAMLRLVGQYETALKEILMEPYDSLTYIERVE